MSNYFLYHKSIIFIIRYDFNIYLKNTKKVSASLDSSRVKEAIEQFPQGIIGEGYSKVMKYNKRHPPTFWRFCKATMFYITKVV